VCVNCLGIHNTEGLGKEIRDLELKHCQTIMDTMMESPILQQPSIGEQARSVSPTGSRKRAFEEVDGVVDNQRDAAIEPKINAQAVSTPKGDDICQPPLNVTTANGPAPTTSILLPSTSIGTENEPIESVSMDTKATPSPAVASTPVPVPTPKTPLRVPAMPNKKVKLSPASLEAKRIEKEIRDRQRAEERAKKEEEKRVREEEKKRREEEREEEKKKKEEEKRKRDEEREEERKKREEKKKVKEEERLAREEEKRKKEDEKLKKERVSAMYPISTPVLW
jgi:chromatin assembly factor 1 subunit A